MLKVKKDGITKSIAKKDLQEYLDWGFKVVEDKPHKPEPMIVEDTKEEVKPKTKKAE